MFVHTSPQIRRSELAGVCSRCSTWGSRRQAVRCRPVGAWVWRAFARDARPGAHAARLYDVAPLGLGYGGRLLATLDLGLTPPGCTMSPRWGWDMAGVCSRCSTWGSRRQAVRCRPVGAGIWRAFARDARPGAHAARLYDVAPLDVSLLRWRAMIRPGGRAPPGSGPRRRAGPARNLGRRRPGRPRIRDHRDRRAGHASAHRRRPPAARPLCLSNCSTVSRKFAMCGPNITDAP